ncbi:MAG: MFS transporter [Candidatus Methanofastidiosia archaeon]|jgi:predicted MFS family arabinose efflux permease
MNKLQMIAAAAFCMTLAWSMYQATFNNFVGEELKIAASQLGVLHSIREIPGLLTVVLSALLVYVSESKIAAISLFVCGIGFMGIAVSNNFYQLILPVLIMSTGFHFFFPVRSSMTIDVSAAGSKAESLGKIGSVQALAALCAFAVVFLVVDAVQFRGVFLLAGVAAMVGGAVLLPMKVTGKPFKRKHIIIKRKYTNFYFLQFFSGCRRHIFTTFAIFSLVVIHGLSVKYVTLLLAITNVISLYTRTKIGRLIDQFGEKSALTITYVVLIFVFLGYGYLQNIYVLGGLYCLDHILFGSNVALPSYISKIAKEGDVAPSLAFGSTINHVAAIFIPVLGGLIWDAYGYYATFVLGAGLLLFSIFFAQRIEV